MQRTRLIIGSVLALMVAGCADILSIYGINGGGGADPPPQEGLRNLSAVDFNDDVPLGTGRSSSLITFFAHHPRSLPPPWSVRWN